MVELLDVDTEEADGAAADEELEVSELLEPSELLELFEVEADVALVADAAAAVAEGEVEAWVAFESVGCA